MHITIKVDVINLFTLFLDNIGPPELNILYLYCEL